MADDIGATYGAEPLATLTATNEALVLSGTRGTYAVPRAAITRIGRGKMYPWFFSAVRIHHRAPKLPAELQFKPMTVAWREVVQHLGSMGYPVR
jgi:hypothetical protein